MKKIKSLFQRDYKGNRQVYDEVVPGCEWVLAGEGIATEKFDGTACMIQDDKLHKRYDRKRNKKTGEHKSAPDGWIPCEDEPNEHTGHWPGWVPVSADNPADKWHVEAEQESINRFPITFNGTYELVGPKVQKNPYGLPSHELWLHGAKFRPSPGITFAAIKEFLRVNVVEGIVWHHPDGRMAKIKRKDFGLEWPVIAKGDGRE